MYPQEYKSVGGRPRMIRTVDIAARKGNLEILRIMYHQHNCLLSMETATAAALSGNKLCLEYLMLNGCEIADTLVNYAFASGSVDCLKYVHETLGCSWTNHLFEVLDVQKQPRACDELLLLQCLEYAQANECPNPVDACFVCAKHMYALLLQNLHERGSHWDPGTVRMAVFRGHLPCLKYAMEHGCPYCDNILWHAILYGQVEAVSYLRQRGVPWPDLSYIHMGLNDDTDPENIARALIHAYKLGCPPAGGTCIFAAEYGFYDLMVCAHQHGCSWDTYCTREAARGNHLQCLMYLHEHGCPWDEETTKFALEYHTYFPGKYDCLNYAMEHGCPISKVTMRGCEALVQEGAIEHVHS